MADKRPCLYCEREGAWESGICPRYRAYLKRTGERPMAWRIERKESIERWGELLSNVIGKRTAHLSNVVHLRARKVAHG